MSRNGSGSYSATVPGGAYPAVAGTTVEATKFNTLISDMATALTQSIATDGQSTISANIPMNSHKFTGMTDGSADTDSATYKQIKEAARGKIHSITATVASNALTVTLNPTVLDFRSATITSGTVNTRTVSAAISVVAPSGADLGLIANQTTRIIVFAIDNAGTVELAIANANWSNLEIDESGLISTTAIDANADSNGIIYSTTARSNVPYRIVGFFDITLATPGTWNANPTKIQGMGGLAGSNLIGNQYSWNDMTASRAVNTTYYNEKNRDLFVNATITANTTAAPVLNIGGIGVRGSTQSSFAMSVFGVVAPGESYSLSSSAGTPTLISWFERY